MVHRRLQFVSLIVLVCASLISAKFDIESVKVGFFYNIYYNNGKGITIWPYEINEVAEVLNNTQFYHNQTVFYIPDYDEHAHATQNEISYAYLKRGTVNYLQIIWTSSELPNQDDMKVLASGLTEQILKMFDSGLKRESFHLLAYAEGNEFAGFLAEEFIDQATKLYRITSLDQPVAYYQKIAFQRITKYHADFVDAIHTDRLFYGSNFKLAHADFWPNGGEAPQPGCSIETVYEDYSKCSHQRAYAYWAESVANVDGPDFTAYPAKNYNEFQNNGPKGSPVPMGINCPTSASGSYFLNTNSEEPYAKDPGGR